MVNCQRKISESLLDRSLQGFGYPSSNIFNLNGGYHLSDNVSLRFGIDNMFYKRPRLINVDNDADPAEGELTGGSWNFFDDTQGRRFSFGANMRF